MQREETRWEQGHGPRMDFEDCPVWYSSLDIGWIFAPRLSIQAEGIRRSQGAMGDNNTNNSLLRLYTVLAVSPPNSKSG
jgi:hypothetical protein